MVYGYQIGFRQSDLTKRTGEERGATLPSRLKRCRMEELKESARFRNKLHYPTPPNASRRCQFCSVFSTFVEKEKKKNICALLYLFQKHLLLVPAPTTCWRTAGSLSRPNQTTLLRRPHTKHTLQRSRCSASQAEQTPSVLIQTATFSLTRTVYIFLMGRFQVIYPLFFFSTTPPPPLPVLGF